MAEKNSWTLKELEQAQRANRQPVSTLEDDVFKGIEAWGATVYPRWNFTKGLPGYRRVEGGRKRPSQEEINLRQVFG
jgi:hypothetical protein